MVWQTNQNQQALSEAAIMSLCWFEPMINNHAKKDSLGHNYKNNHQLDVKGYVWQQYEYQ